MILLFLEIMTQRIELFFEETYMTLRIELFSQNLRIDPFYQYDSLQEFKLFEPFHMTQRIEQFLEYDSKNWTCFKMTQRIEPFPQNDSKILFFGFDSELIFFDYDSQKGIVLFTLTLTIEPFSKYDPKDWTFLIDWLIWSKGLFFLWWVTESNTFLNTKELNLLFSWRKELNPFFGETQLNTFPIQRIEHSFWIRLTELNLFLECDSKNWTGFSQNWLKELNLFFSQYDLQQLNLFEKYDSKDWTF